MPFFWSGRQADAPAWRPNLTWITDHLAVGGSFPPERTEHLAQALRIAAVIDLRSEDRDDEANLKRHGIAFLHLPTDDHGAITPSMIADGIGFARPYLALCIMVESGFAPLDALELAKDKRALVSPSPAQFECWTRWMTGLRKTRQVDWEMPSFDAFKAIAYRHLGQS